MVHFLFIIVPVFKLLVSFGVLWNNEPFILIITDCIILVFQVGPSKPWLVGVVSCRCLDATMLVC